MHQQIIRRSQLPEILGISLATVDRLRKVSDFPAPVRLGAQAVGWLRADIDAWVFSRRPVVH